MLSNWPFLSWTFPKHEKWKKKKIAQIYSHPHMIQATEFNQSSIVQGRGICFLHASDFIGKTQIENIMPLIRALFF